MTRAEIEGREGVVHAINGLRHSVPGFENSQLRNFGMTIGTPLAKRERETEREKETERERESVCVCVCVPGAIS